MNKPVLFIDIDGVLNFDGQDPWPTSAEFAEAFKQHLPDTFLIRLLDSGRLALLRSFIQQVPKVKIVIHSTWRKRLQDRIIPFLSKAADIPEDRFAPVAPFKFSSTRGHEVRMWLEEYDPQGVLRYAILDDKPEEFSFFPEGAVFAVDSKLGLTVEIVARLTRYYSHLETSDESNSHICGRARENTGVTRELSAHAGDHNRPT